MIQKTAKLFGIVAIICVMLAALALPVIATVMYHEGQITFGGALRLTAFWAFTLGLITGYFWDEDG